MIIKPPFEPAHAACDMDIGEEYGEEVTQAQNPPSEQRLACDSGRGQ